MLIGSCVTRNGDCFSQLREVFDRVTNTFWVYDTTFFGFCQVYKVKKNRGGGFHRGFLVKVSSNRLSLNNPLVT